MGDDIFFTDEKRFVLKKPGNKSNDLIRIEKADKKAMRLGLKEGLSAFNAIKS